MKSGIVDVIFDIIYFFLYFEQSLYTYVVSQEYFGTVFSLISIKNDSETIPILLQNKFHLKHLECDPPFNVVIIPSSSTFMT